MLSPGNAQEEIMTFLPAKFSTKCTGSVTENIHGSLTNASDPHKEKTATPSPAPSPWAGGAWWGTEGNNYRLVITSSLNGFSLISDGFTSNLKVITCNLNGFLLWGRRRSSRGACKEKFLHCLPEQWKTHTCTALPGTIEPFPAARKGPGHTQQPPPCLMASTVWGTLRWQLHGGTHSICAPLLGAIPTQIWLFQGYFTAELVQSDQIGQKDMKYITQRSSENPAPEHGAEGQGFWWEAAMPWSYLSSNLPHNF